MVIERSTNTNSYSPAASPTTGFSELLTGIWTAYESILNAGKAEKIGDREGIFDHLSIAAQKPASALNALSGLTVKIIEIGSYFHWFGNMAFIVPLSKAVSGLGIVLCISEIFLETISLKRSKVFESNFIHSPAPQKQSNENLVLWAYKTEKIVKKLQDERPDQNLGSIQTQLRNLQNKITDTQQEKNVIQLVEKINKTILRQDFFTLNKRFTDASENAALKAKLYRRLGVKFVDKYINTIQDLAKEIQSENPSQESINKALKILDKMHIQLEKRQNAHKIGIAGASILLLGLVVGLTLACPPLAIALIFLGTIVGVGRFFYWTAYAESDGWNNDLGIWIETKLTNLYKSLIKPFAEEISSLNLSGPNCLPVNLGKSPVAKVE